MANGGYGYDPYQKKSDVTQQIVDDANKIALKINDDTVRKYLKEATELIPQDSLES
jgi:hypothetical protein